MSQRITEKVKLPPVDQIGFVVRDVDKAVGHYSSMFGWGPFNVTEIDLKGVVFRGHPGNCRLKVARSDSGPVEIELIQVLEGETPHTEFLRERGEGVQHLRFRVDDLKGILSTLAKEGIHPLFSFENPRASFAYVNSDRGGGLMFEFLEMKTGFPR